MVVRAVLRSILTVGFIIGSGIASPPQAMAQGSESAADPLPTEERTSWCFKLQGKDVAYLKLPKGWVFARPGKAVNDLEEIDRTESEIVLQNVRTKLIIRLTERKSYWRQPNQTEWTTYATGQWAPPHSSVVDWIAQQTGDKVSVGSDTKSRQPNPEAMTVKSESPRPPPRRPRRTSVPMPVDPAYQVRVIYFVPSDRKPVANWEAKLRVLVHYVDTFYRNDLQAKGWETAGLQWQRSGNEVKIHPVAGRRPAAYYNGEPAFDKNRQFQKIQAELTTLPVGKAGTLRLVLCETYDPGPSDVLWKGSFALGAYGSARGGLAMFSAHILRDEFCALSPRNQTAKFFDRTPLQGRRAMGHRMHSPRCEFAEDGFGAVIHELGHALGLPHDFRDHDRYVMSNGFRQIARNLSPQTPADRRVTFSDTSTMLLGSSRFLNPAINRNDNQAPQAALEASVVAENRVRLTVSAGDSQGLRGFIVMDNVAQVPVAGGPLNGTRFTTQQEVLLKPESGQLKVTLIAIDQGGNQTRQRETLAARR